jgi:hypothetical protein
VSCGERGEDHAPEFRHRLLEGAIVNSILLGALSVSTLLIAAPLSALQQKRAYSMIALV